MAYKDREWCRERNICTRCKKQEAFNGRALCADCLYYYSEYYHRRKNDPEVKERGKEHRRNFFAKKVANGLCVSCGKPVCERSKYHCDTCRRLHNKRQLELYYKRKNGRCG